MYFKQQLNTSKSRIINSNIDTIPWEECARVYDQAADQAESNALAAAQDLAHRQWTRARQDALRVAGISEAEAPYEGDLGIEAAQPRLDPKQRLEIRRRAGQEAIREYFIKPYQLKSWGSRILDQILQLYSQHRLNSLGSLGTVSGLEYLKQNLDHTDLKQVGMYRFLMLDARSDYLEKMGTGENKKYCTLVPLILYAHKLYSNVPYAQWERETLEYVVNPALCDAMLTQVPELSPERVLELRETGLVQAGSRRNPQSTYSLYRLGDTELAQANALVKIMVCQTWAAHPTNRTKYMVLDPMSWDTMPVPILDGKAVVISPPTNTTQTYKVPADLPWLA
jgi:hypothetical protein